MKTVSQPVALHTYTYAQTQMGGMNLKLHSGIQPFPGVESIVVCAWVVGLSLLEGISPIYLL